jgi:hypothetical protein
MYVSSLTTVHGISAVQYMHFYVRDIKNNVHVKFVCSVHSLQDQIRNFRTVTPTCCKLYAPTRTLQQCKSAADIIIQQLLKIMPSNE